MTIKTVLVTRPEPAATQTADKLKALGFSPFVLPFSMIIPLDVLNIPDADALIMTSVNALRFLTKAQLEKIRHKPLYCVGAETAHQAQQKGFSHIVSYKPTAKELAVELIGQNRHYLYLAGRVRRPDLESALKNEKLDLVEVYTTQLCDVMESNKAQLPTVMDAVLLYSAFGHENLLLLKEHFSEKTGFFCLSQRIADTLPKDLLGQIFIADRPDEKALFDKLTFVS